MNKNNRSGGRSGLRGVIIALVAAAAVLIAVLMLFRIRTVTVVGNERYAKESIQSDLIRDFWSENTLLFAWKYKKAVYDSHAPYLSSIQAKMTGPSAVTITVQENPIIGYLDHGGNHVGFDESGKVLLISAESMGDATQVTGIEIGEPILYQKLPLDNTALLRTMLSITKLMKESGLTPDQIIFDENLNITLSFGAVTVELGQDEYLEEKVANLVAIYPQISAQSGSLNMSAFTGKNETITFKEQETEAVTEAQTEEEIIAPDGEEQMAQGEAPAQDTAPQENQDNQDGQDNEEQGNAENQEEEPQAGDSSTPVMVFDSSGTLRYDAHISGGQVVDANGTPIDGCTVTEDGYIKDAYWNVIDPQTGQLVS